MDSYIIRIYRYVKENPRKIVGTTEKVGDKKKLAFATIDELWEILNATENLPRRKKEDRGAGGGALDRVSRKGWRGNLKSEIRRSL